MSATTADIPSLSSTSSSALTTASTAVEALTILRALSYVICVMLLFFPLKLTSKILASAALINSGLKVVMRNWERDDSSLIRVAIDDRY